MEGPSSSHSDLPTPPAGFKKLLDRLKKAGIGPEGSLASIEATGHYWVALFNFMAAYGYDAAHAQDRCDQRSP